MSQIVQYEFEQTRNFMDQVASSYEKKLLEILNFEDWKTLELNTIYNNPEKFSVEPYQWGSPIRIAPSGVEMSKIILEHLTEIQDIELNTPVAQQDLAKTELFKRILKPVNEFTIDSPIMLDGTTYGKPVKYPIWFNTTMKSANLRPGFAKLDTALPACLPLSDAPVHGMLGGITGSGKSVMLNDLIVSALYEYPPWELELVLADFKIVELSRYANRIPTPNVSVVAATGSVEFAQTMFKYIEDEMLARQEVFAAVGVQNIRDFRKKFNLALPRIILIADEFVQMFVNIKVSAAAGNDRSEELKQSINNSISALSRLGRSQGIHMLLSSQEMDGVLDDQTAGQFGGGICLKSNNAVSNTLIGNAAGAKLEGKGKAYLNLNKDAKNSEDNTLVWVPWINDEISAEDAAAGKLSYLQQCLWELSNLAVQCGWTRKPFFYNERETLPRPLLENVKKYALECFHNPNTGSQLTDEIFRKEAFAVLPLGKEIALSDAPGCTVSIRYRRMANLLIGSTEELTRIYIMRLIAEGLSLYKCKNVVLSANYSLYAQTQFESLLDSLEVIPQAEIPVRYLNMMDVRADLISLQQYITAKGGTGCWDAKLGFIYCVEGSVATRQSVSPNVVLAGEHMRYEFESVESEDDVISGLDLELNKDELAHLLRAITKFNRMRKTLHQITKGTFEVITASSFEPVVVWWVGMEEISGIESYEAKQRLLGFLERSPTVGIFNIVVGVHWQKLGPYAEKCNFVLERCAKSFFMDINLPKNININPNSFQLHDRELRTRNIIRMFNN